MASDDELFGEMRKIVSSAIADALAQAEGITDRDAAYRQLSWLADTFAAATTASGRGRAEVARQMKEAEGLSFAQLGQRLGVSRARAADMLRVSQARQPEAPPVAAAIVTSDRGVLAGRRNDNAPSWTFLAGEVEPGESAADAAVREVKEEAGIDVVVGRVLGRRVHPATNRTMIYMTARPTGSLDVAVGDQVELAEVRWLTLAEADDLLTGMYPPVRAYLGRALRPRHPAPRT